MLTHKKGQSANEAALIISFLTFFMIITLASVADDILQATNNNLKSDLQDLADVIEQEGLTAFGSENGYYHSFILPQTINGQPYVLSMINSSSIGPQANISMVFVASGNPNNPLNITKVLPRDVLGSVVIGPNSVRKENGIVIFRPLPPLLKYPGEPCTKDSECINTICGTDADADGFFSQALGHTGSCQGTIEPYTDCYDSNANALPGQIAYFTTPRGDGSYDYNCDGVQTPQGFAWSVGTCTTSGSSCNGANMCAGTQKGVVPGGCVPSPCGGKRNYCSVKYYDSAVVDCITQYTGAVNDCITSPVNDFCSNPSNTRGVISVVIVQDPTTVSCK